MNEGLAALSILVVDDNAQMRAIIGAVLMGAGVRRIHYAENGERALEMIASQAIDVIYLDNQMPKMSGLQMLKILRGFQNDNRFVSVIMVTGQSDIERITAARDHGVNEFLGKPVTAKSLLSRLEAVILHPRPYCEASDFFGPDRRRRRDENGVAQRRRAADRVAPASA